MEKNKGPQNNVVTGGAVGGFFNGGNYGTVVVASQEPRDPSQEYTGKVVAKLPRQGVLSLMTGLISIFVFVTGWNSLAPALSAVGGVFRDTDGAAPPPPTPNAAWLAGLLVTVIVLAALVAGIRLVRHQTFQLPRLSLLPALAGITDEGGHRRLALVRFRGSCVRCGGRLLFRLEATRWHDETANGRTHRVVDERTPVAVCRKSNAHMYKLDVTDKVA